MKRICRYPPIDVEIKRKVDLLAAEVVEKEISLFPIIALFRSRIVERAFEKCGNQLATAKFLGCSVLWDMKHRASEHG